VSLKTILSNCGVAEKVAYWRSLGLTPHSRWLDEIKRDREKREFLGRTARMDAIGREVRAGLERLESRLDHGVAFNDPRLKGIKIYGL
jgi:hypothetical protein